MTNRSVFRKQVAIGDTVGSIIAGTNAKDFAVVALGVGAGAQGIESTLLFALVDRSKTLGVTEGIGIVARADVQASIGSEFHRTGMVTTLFALLLVFHQNLFALKIQRSIGSDCKATDVLARKIRWRVLQVHPTVLCELGIQGDADQSIFLLSSHLERSDRLGLAGIRIDGFDLTS